VRLTHSLCNPALPPPPHITVADRQNIPYIDSRPPCHDGERVASTQAPAARVQSFSCANASQLCRADLFVDQLSVAPTSRLCAACASGPSTCLAFHTSHSALYNQLCKRSNSRRALDLHGHQSREPSRQVSSRDRACGKRADLLGSPTNTRVPPIAPEHQRYPHSATLPQPSLAPFSPALTSGPSRSLQDTAPSSQPPLASLRQDSAVSHRIDSVKEPESCLPSSVFAFSYFHPANGRQSNTSRPVAHPTGPSSPHSPASDSRSVQSPSEAGSQSLKHTHSQAVCSGPHISADSARSPEHVGGPPVTPSAESGSKNPLSSPVSDQTNGTVGNNRPQRYNVRFNPVYTSENMPPNQRPRHDPAPLAPVTTETSEPRTPAQEQTVRPSVEPAIIVPVPQSTQDQQQQQQRGNTGPQVERCPGCQEPWRRPLPAETMYRMSSPAQGFSDQVKMTEDFITRLTNHTKMADEAYENWRRKHRWCGTETASSPPATEIRAESRSKSVEESFRTEAATQTSSVNKRKSDVPHDTSKHRKVTFDTPSNGAQHIRPAAPA
jgi:hypothetical protein